MHLPPTQSPESQCNQTRGIPGQWSERLNDFKAGKKEFDMRNYLLLVHTINIHAVMTADVLGESDGVWMDPSDQFFRRSHISPHNLRKRSFLSPLDSEPSISDSARGADERPLTPRWPKGVVWGCAPVVVPPGRAPAFLNEDAYGEEACSST